MKRSELVLAVYIPTALLAMAQGLLLATLPSYANSLGISVTLISVIVSAAAIGTLVSDVPAGILLHRIGLRRAMLIGSALVVIGTGALAISLSPGAVISLRLLSGIGTALWGLSRHAFIAQSTTAENRGRSIAMFGGINRVGLFAGPAVGGVIATVSSTRYSFVAAALLGLCAFIAAALFIPSDREHVLERRGSGRKRWDIVGKTVRVHSTDLLAAGVAQLFAQMIRQGRQLLIPLVGQDMGLNLAEVGLVMTVSAVIDMCMFVPAGILMDRYGRKFASVPSFAVMAAGIGLIPVVGSFAGLMAIGVVIGLGNGLGSGSMMTLGADLAPKGATGEFLGLWRLMGDVGMVAGPLLVGVVASSLGLDGSALVLMVSGLVASGILLVLVKETRVTSTPEQLVLSAKHAEPADP